MAGKKKTTKNKNLDLVYMGKEPILTRVETLKGLTTPVAKAMGWYHYVHSHDQGKEWLVEWMKLNGYSKDDIKFIKACKNWAIIS